MASLFLKQLLVGRDLAQGDAVAEGMQNFVYLVGDADTRQCLVIDPAWDVAGLVQLVREQEFELVGALATHYHPDHIGGSMFGFSVQGLARLLELAPCPVHAHRLEADGIVKVTGLSKNDIVPHDSGDTIQVGDVEVKLLHTPGHTPGSSCFRVKDALLAGDTLFLQGCGRVDLPGGDPEEMRRTLTQRLAPLADEIVLYPGHAYGGESAPLGDVRRFNPYFPPPAPSSD
ncbi:MAG: MBL fold metallo-hydrolase [Polyangiaceae bacterium]